MGIIAILYHLSFIIYHLARSALIVIYTVSFKCFYYKGMET